MSVQTAQTTTTQSQPTYDWFVEVKRFFLSREVPTAGEAPSTTPTKKQSFPVTHRMIYLFRPNDLPWSLLWTRYARVFLVRRGGEVSYSLSVRKETRPPWWTKDQTPEVADDYTPVRKLTRPELIALLTHWIGAADANRAVTNMETMAPPRRGE